MEVTVRRRRRSKQLLDGLERKRGYFKLKEEALDGTLWRTRIGKRCRPVGKQTMASTKWLYDDRFGRNMQLRIVRRICILFIEFVAAIIRCLFNEFHIFHSVIYNSISTFFIFMGPRIVRYRGGIYDQQDATNSQYLLLEMLYMFRAIIAHHQELGTVCAAVRCINCEVLSSVGYIPDMVLRWW
jgi:hypothetical protein